MKAFIFIPDTKISAGLGHLYRCYQYSNFVDNKFKIIFFIDKFFNKKHLKLKNLNNKTIKYFFISDIEKSLYYLKKNYKYFYTFLDSYNKSFHKINFTNYSKKHISILDFKIKNNADYILDHTFKRQLNYYKKKNVFIGHKYFPFSFFPKKNENIKNTILINFGSVKDKKKILKSLIFIKNLNLSSSFKVIIISKFSKKKDFNKIKLKNKLFLYKFDNNLHKIYKNLLFSIGACGISLYEKCFYNIPTIAIKVANNQSTNFKNFLAATCILDFNKEINVNYNKKNKTKKFLKKIKIIQKNLKKNFNPNTNYLNLKKIFKKFTG